jgi:hypothetical protein
LISPAMPYGCHLLPLSKSGRRYRPDPAHGRLRRRPAISKYQPLETGKGGDKRLMSIVQSIFLRMFGHPQGVLGRLGGLIMARTNEECGIWVADLLEIGPNDRGVGSGLRPRSDHLAPVEPGVCRLCRGCGSVARDGRASSCAERERHPERSRRPAAGLRGGSALRRRQL